MDTKSVVIYKVFHIIIHHVFSIYEFIETLWAKLTLKPGHECLGNYSALEKIPRHLTFLLGPEEPSPVDLANVILWCLAANITFISFYDPKGSLKKQEERLQQLVQEKKRESDHVIWHTNPQFVHKNGYVGRKIHVKVLSRGGKADIVAVTRKFARSGDANFNINIFDGELRRQFEFPDPDLGVCCGKTFNLYGYPPWHVRVTEFLTIKSHHDITSDVFLNLLSSYSKCEQRYGK